MKDTLRSFIGFCGLLLTLADGEHILAHHPDVLRIIEVTDKDVEKQLVTVEGNLTLTTHALLFDTNPMPDDAKWRSRLPWTAVTEILPTTDGYTITARGFTVKARKGSKDVTRTFRFFSLEPEFMALLLLGKHLHKFRVVGKQFV